MYSRGSVLPFTVEELLYTVEAMDSRGSRRWKLLNTVEMLDSRLVYGNVGLPGVQQDQAPAVHVPDVHQEPAVHRASLMPSIFPAVD